MRSTSPKAAVDLPLPVPVWTISKPFSIVFSATSASCTALRFAILARYRSASSGVWSVTSQGSLHRQRQSGDHEDDTPGARRDLLIENALMIAKPPAERVIRHDAVTHFVRYQHHRRRHGGKRGFELSDFRLDIHLRQHQV